MPGKYGPWQARAGWVALVGGQAGARPSGARGHLATESCTDAPLPPAPGPLLFPVRQVGQALSLPPAVAGGWAPAAAGSHPHSLDGEAARPPGQHPRVERAACLPGLPPGPCHMPPWAPRHSLRSAQLAPFPPFPLSRCPASRRGAAGAQARARVCGDPGRAAACRGGAPSGAWRAAAGGGAARDGPRGGRGVALRCGGVAFHVAARAARHAAQRSLSASDDLSRRYARDALPPFPSPPAPRTRLPPPFKHDTPRAAGPGDVGRRGPLLVCCRVRCIHFCCTCPDPHRCPRSPHRRPLLLCSTLNSLTLPYPHREADCSAQRIGPDRTSHPASN